MTMIKVVYDQLGNTLTIWFGNPEDEVVAEEAAAEPEAAPQEPETPAEEPKQE